MNYFFIFTLIPMLSYSQKTDINESEKKALNIIKDSIKLKKLLAVRQN